MKSKLLFTDQWTFFLDKECGTELPADRDNWMPVTLPHDWQIWDTTDLYEDGTGWYRTIYELPKSTGTKSVVLPFEYASFSEPSSSAYNTEAGTRTALYFDGVYQDSTLFVNGIKVGDWKNGYSSFYFDITDYLSEGENEILVRCVVKHPNSRWYSGAGIYRKVWLLTYPEVHFLPDSLYIAAREQSSETWKVHVSAEIAAGKGKNQSLPQTVNFTIKDASGRVAAETGCPWSQAEKISEEEVSSYINQKETNLTSNKKVQSEWEIYRISTDIFIKSPDIWDIDHPVCYELTSGLETSDPLSSDSLIASFGFRTVEMKPDTGFWLNHRHLVLHGVCMHHDLGCLGSAFHRAAAERQMKILLQMGVNAIRTSHNMPAPEIMELADRYGILIVSEAFDCWKNGKNAYDYHCWFDDWYERDVAGWVRRDRNHPSLIMWSIGNEVYDTHNRPDGKDTTRRLIAAVRQHDPMGNGVPTFGSNYMAWENTQNCADIIKVAGYNYGEKLYDRHHAEHPDWIIYGSETASIIQSRGIYHFPRSQSLLADDDLQCSSLGNSRTSWGAASSEAVLAGDVDHPFSLGQFLWSGFDYIGEPTPYHTRNSYFGQIDTAGFEKDSFYRYQAGWTDYHEKPMVHLLPYWDFNDGQLIDIAVISNAPQVELFLNGESLGRRTLDCRVICCADYQALFTRGCLEAYAYDETGNVIATAREVSFGDAVSLSVEKDPSQKDKVSLLSDGEDILFLVISALDKDGNPVKNANNRIHFTVEGSGCLLGLDNGNSADDDFYKCNDRQLFSGKLLAMIGANKDAESRPVKVTVSSPGMESVCFEIPVKPQVESQVGSPEKLLKKLPENNEQLKGQWMPVLNVPVRTEIPVRKIELGIGCPVLSPDKPETVVTAKLLPANSTFRQIKWRVTDDIGLTATAVEAEIDKENPYMLHITGKGDGKYRVRCTCTNGKSAPELLSAIEVEVTGMGKQYPDPYTYMSASLYTGFHAEIGNGNERGIATSRTEMSWVCYDMLDFGRSGADTIDIDIFEMAGIPTPIRFWKGVPYEEGSEMIGERIYDKPTTWNVYKPEHFTFDQILRGVQTFGIELQCKVHIKGFSFRRRSRAFDEIKATDRDLIYGDTFTEMTDSITGIGNNVSLVFGEMDFGTEGTDHIEICGRSLLENNSIHICFHGEEKREENQEKNPEENQTGNISAQEADQRRIVEFAGSPEWSTQSFEFDPVYGMQEVTFLFLPGCDFDFKNFRFLRKKFIPE